MVISNYYLLSSFLPAITILASGLVLHPNPSTINPLFLFMGILVILMKMSILNLMYFLVRFLPLITDKFKIAGISLFMLPSLLFGINIIARLIAQNWDTVETLILIPCLIIALSTAIFTSFKYQAHCKEVYNV